MKHSAKDLDWPQFARTAKGQCELMICAYKQLGIPHVEESTEVFVLRHGEEFEKPRLPDRLEEMEPGMCFMNCFELARDWNDLTYCEGWVIQDEFPLPIHHAWCIDGDGQAVEPTIIIDNFKTLSYFGIVIPDFDSLVEVAEETGTYSVLYKRQGHAMIERMRSAVQQ